jgi:DNA invertase Pin-like site-specific DNA recombinase
MIAYLRVSTDDQARSGYGLDAQRASLQRHAELHGWELRFIEDTASGGNTNRPGLTYALELLRVGQADGLVASHLDRVSRSVLDFADLLQRARAEKWNLAVLDLNLDLSSPQGEFVAHILAAVAQLERRLISERTRAALAAASRRGVVPGPRRRVIPAPTLDLITGLRDRGNNLTEIAGELNRRGLPLPSGRAGTWGACQVGRVLQRARELKDDGPLR